MRKFLICYFFFLLFFLSFFVSGVIDSQDGLQYLAVARNIYYKGEPTGPIYEYPTKNIHMSTYVGKNGKTYSTTNLGYSLAMVPAVAITDIFYKIYNVAPPVHFPLESDWLIFLLASFTNCFFAAGLGTILFFYFLALKLNKKQAFFMSLVTIFTTNLFALSKHSFAHMMFTFFLILSFYCVKRYFDIKKRAWLFFSGIAYGVVIISYNQTFFLPFLPYVLYYFFQRKPNLDFNSVKKVLLDGFTIFLGVIPFIWIYQWYEFTRESGLGSVSVITFYGKSILSNIPVGVYLEGLYGQLLSPGRSMFLYSPTLLIIILFWHKIRKKILPELLVFILMSIIYINFYAIQRSGRPDELGYTGLWHGESSWGPRYLVPLIPFGMLVVGDLYKNFSRRTKLLIFLPLALFGLYVEILGVFMPYQIKFHDLQKEFIINSTQYTYFTYVNLLPRYSPLFMMSKKLVKLIINTPKTLDHGPYNVRFYDGIDFPFNLGGSDRWRVIEGKGYISFDDRKEDSLKEIQFNLVNHPLINTASSSARINFILNSKKLFDSDQIIGVNERKTIKIPIKRGLVKEKYNDLIVDVHFDDENVVKKHSQILGMISVFLNNKEVNKESIDVPYVSPFGPKMMGKVYKNFGAEGSIRTYWRSWDIHTQIFERVPDFWWSKAIYYWDFPKRIFLMLFIINFSSIIFFGYKVYRAGKGISKSN